MFKGVGIDLFDGFDEPFLNDSFQIWKGRECVDGGPGKMKPSGEVGPQQYHN